MNQASVAATVFGSTLSGIFGPTLDKVQHRYNGSVYARVFGKAGHAQIHKDGTPVKNPCPLVGRRDGMDQFDRQRLDMVDSL